MWEIGGNDGGKLRRGFFKGCRGGQGGGEDACLHSLGNL